MIEYELTGAINDDGLISICAPKGIVSEKLETWWHDHPEIKACKDLFFITNHISVKEYLTKRK